MVPHSCSILLKLLPRQLVKLLVMVIWIMPPHIIHGPQPHNTGPSLGQIGVGGTEKDK